MARWRRYRRAVLLDKGVPPSEVFRLTPAQITHLYWHARHLSGKREGQLRPPYNDTLTPPPPQDLTPTLERELTVLASMRGLMDDAKYTAHLEKVLDHFKVPPEERAQYGGQQPEPATGPKPEPKSGRTRRPRRRPG